MTAERPFNGLFRFVLTVILGLIMGAYGYTWLATDAVERRIDSRLIRIESKVDKLIEHAGGG